MPFVFQVFKYDYNGIFAWDLHVSVKIYSKLSFQTRNIYVTYRFVYLYCLHYYMFKVQ